MGGLESTKQLKLFTLGNPLTERFGNEFFRELPQSPGVYFFYDVTGKLLYVGQSSNLRNRVSSYRHVSSEKHPRRILRLVARIQNRQRTQSHRDGQHLSGARKHCGQAGRSQSRS